MATPAPYSNPSMTPADVEQRRRMAAALMQQGTDASPVGHWTQGLARVLQGGMGGYYSRTASDAEKEGIASRGAFITEAMKNPSAAVSSGIANSWTTDMAGDIGGKLIGQKVQQASPEYDLGLKLKQAQINNLNRREEPEIVRQLRAAGVNPQSEQGRQIIMNSIKGGDPISQAVGQAIQGQFAPQPQSPIRPQSFNSQQADPALIPTQVGGGQPQAQPQADMVDTPLGKMPRNNAALLGFGIAMQGKGEAGKMMTEAANAGNLGKEGQNELDKKMIAAGDNLTNLATIRAQFRPEFQQIETRLGIAWTALADKFKRGQAMIKPEDRAQLEAFSAYRSDSLDAMNTYIKAITGAAMTDAEAKRILGALPAVGEGIFDGDGPSAFKSKLDAAYRKTAMAVARYNYARQNGKDWQYIGLNQVEKMIDQEGDRRAAEYRKMGVPDAEIAPRVKQDLKRQFGINI